MSLPPNHPNAQLHEKLFEAAQAGTLTAEFIQQTVGLDYQPNIEKDAAAYVNWSTTAVIEGPFPAQVWFAGAGYDLGIQKSPDTIRDTHSLGIYYWWVNDRNVRAHPDQEDWFFVKQYRYQDKRTKEYTTRLYIEVYTPQKNIVAIYDGSQTETVTNSLVDFYGSFYGKGLWGFVKK